MCGYHMELGFGAWKLAYPFNSGPSPKRPQTCLTLPLHLMSMFFLYVCVCAHVRVPGDSLRSLSSEAVHLVFWDIFLSSGNWDLLAP